MQKDQSASGKSGEGRLGGSSNSSENGSELGNHPEPGSDKDGNTPSHLAVQSGNEDGVKLLLLKGADMSVENIQYNTPMDITDKMNMIELLDGKIVDDSFKIMEDVLSWERPEAKQNPIQINYTKSNASMDHSEQSKIYKEAPTDTERNINQTKEKIKYCLKSLKKLNESGNNIKHLSKKEATVLIYFLSNLVLNDSSDQEFTDKMKKHRSQCDINRYENIIDDLEKNPFKIWLEKTADDFRFEIRFTNNSTMDRRNDEKLSNEQAYVLIYFREAFALEGFDIKQIGQRIKNHELFETILDGTTDQDISPMVAEKFIEFIDQTMKSFFEKLQESLQHLYTQANILIYFVEAFALEGSGDPKLKNEMKRYFSICYSKCDMDIISKARIRLLKCAKRKLRLEDVHKFMNVDDTESFFTDLQQYLEHVESCLKKLDVTSATPENEDVNTPTPLKKFMEEVTRKDPKATSSKTRQMKNKATEKEKSDARIFWIGQLKKLSKIACAPEEVTQEDLFNFIVVYPVLETKSKLINVLNDITELRSLRNRLLHQFDKLGCVEFADEVSRLRYKLFRYCYALEVREVLYICAKRPGDIVANKVLEKLNERLKSLYDDGENCKTEHVLSEMEAIDKCEYKYDKTLLPAKVRDPEILVCRYLWFTILMSSPNTKKDNSISSSDESSISDDRKKISKSPWIMSDFNERETFNQFCELEEYRKCDTERYDKKRQEFRTKLIDHYGVQDYHFDKVYQSFTEFNDKPVDDSVAKQITNTSIVLNKFVNNLKKIVKKCKFAGRQVIHEYERYVNEDCRPLRFQMFGDVTLPSNEIIRIPINNETYEMRAGNVVIETFKILHNPYHVYKKQVTVEEMFKDQTFLDYLVDEDTKARNTEQSVDAYLKMEFMINSLKQAAKKCPNCSDEKIHHDISFTEQFEQFLRLQLLAKDLQYNISKANEYSYDEEKQQFKTHLISRCCCEEPCSEVKNRIDNLYRLFIETKDCEFSDQEVIKKIKPNIDNLQEELKSLKLENKKLFYDVYRSLTDQGSYDDFKSVWENDNRVKKILKTLEQLHNDLNKKSEVNIHSGNILCNIVVWDVVRGMLKALKGKLQLESVERTNTLINLLLKIDCTAPYIARLLTKVESDVTIDTEGLVKLVEILSKGDKLYIERLNGLLCIKSSKFNFYQKLCDQILKHDHDVESMRIIFNDLQHVAGIFADLNRRIKGINESPDQNPKEYSQDDEKVLRKILQSLNNEVLELLEWGDKAKALVILDWESEILSADENPLKTSDPIVLEHWLRKAEALMALGHLEEAQRVLSKLPEETNQHYLLAASYKAEIFTATLNYDEAQKAWKTLLGKIGECAAHNEEACMDATSYWCLLALSKKNDKHLYIPLIRLKMIYCALKSNDSNRSNSHCQEYKWALEEYKIHTSYRYKLTSQIDDLVTYFLVQIMTAPGRIYRNPEDNELSLHKVSLQLSCTVLAEQQKVLINIMNESYLGYPSEPRNTLRNMEAILSHYAIAKLSQRNYTAAKQIYERIIELRKKYGFYNFSIPDVPVLLSLQDHLLSLQHHITLMSTESCCDAEKKLLDQANNLQLDTVGIRKLISDVSKHTTYCLNNPRECRIPESYEQILHLIIDSVQDLRRQWSNSALITELNSKLEKDLPKKSDQIGGYDIEITEDILPSHDKINDDIVAKFSASEKQQSPRAEVIAGIRGVIINVLEKRFKPAVSVKPILDFIRQYSRSEMSSEMEKRVQNEVGKFCQAVNSHEQELKSFIDLLTTYCVTDRPIDEKLFHVFDKYLSHLAVILMSNADVAF